MNESRKALLDALEALQEHLEAIVLVGAHAVYMHTFAVSTPVADMTKDADLALNTSLLGATPLIELVLQKSGFQLGKNPGSWISQAGVPVDLMVPERLTIRSGRGAGVAPHATNSARNTAGIEGCLIDNSRMHFGSFDSRDKRSFEILVAGPTALLIAKAHKIGERIDIHRSIDNKDAHDVYKILRAVDTQTLASTMQILLEKEFSGASTKKGLNYIKVLFADGVDSPGSQMAGAAERDFDNSAFVSNSVSLLASDLLEEIGWS
jgi:hypothetical protein